MKGFKVLVFSPFINNISNLLGDVFLETSWPLMTHELFAIFLASMMVVDIHNSDGG